jgi:hypothetical protein
MKKLNEELVLGPYKEPLRKVDEGFGYFGALTFSVDSKIQCHVCGELFDNLSFHVPHAHKLTIVQYREKFGISKSSKLVSEAFRESRKAHMLRMIARMTPEDRAERKRKFLERASKANKERGPKTRGKSNLSPEEVNVRGICPDQLLSLINSCNEKLGHVPSQAEFIDFYQTQRFMPPIRRTFGSWKKAVLAAGLQPIGYGNRSTGNRKYSDEELLDFLLRFYEENQIIPTRSDIGRGYLPHWGIYIKRFGSMPNARRLAGIPEWDKSPQKPFAGKLVKIDK